jgi:hypothetical protein
VTRIIRGPALVGHFIAAALTAASLTMGQAQAGHDQDEVGRMHYQAVFAKAVFAKGGERDAAVRRPEAYLSGPDDAKLPRLPGHIAYWFAWENFLGLHAPLSETVSETVDG